MNDSPTTASAEEIRSRYLGVEDGLLRLRGLLRMASWWVGFGVCVLLMESFNRHMATMRGESFTSGYSFVPNWILGPDRVEAWHCLVAAFVAAGFYALLNQAFDALEPGAGRPWGRAMGWVSLSVIGLFGPMCAWIFCIDPALTLLNPRCRNVMGADYGRIMEATPFITDSTRRKHKRDNRILFWGAIGIVVLLALAFAFAGYSAGR